MEKLQSQYDKSPVKVDLYTIQNLKIALDDLLTKYCSSLGHKENHLVADIQNSVGIVSIILTLVVLAFSYLYKFHEIKHYMALCLYVYFTINILCCIFVFFRGGKITFEKIEILTSIDKNQTYNLEVISKDKKTTKKYNKSVFDLFFESGKLDHQLFLKDMNDLFKN